MRGYKALDHLVALIGDLLVLAFVTAGLEYLIPAGKMKGTAELGIGLVYTALLFEKILGIFEGLGV